MAGKKKSLVGWINRDGNPLIEWKYDLETGSERPEVFACRKPCKIQGITQKVKITVELT